MVREGSSNCRRASTTHSYDFVTIDAAVSDGACRPDGPHRLNVSEDGESVIRTPYEGNQGQSTRSSPEAVELRLVG